MKPKVSVIVPVYNAEKFLQDCIDSLVNQTLEEIEIIFVNDASPDHCLSILKENQGLYPDKIKIIDSKVNLKQGGARNLGIREAQADYIAFVDSDDFVSPTMIEHLYDRTVKRKADVSVIKYATVPEDAVYREYLSQNFEDKLTGIFSWNGKAEKFDGHALSEKGIGKALVIGTGGVCGTLWKKSIISDHNIYFPEHLTYEDNFWSWLMRFYVKRYTYVNEVGYFCRNVGGSTVHARNQLHHYDRIEILHMIFAETKKRGLFSKYYQAIEYNAIMTCFSTYFIFMHKFDHPPRELVKRIPKECLEQFPYWKNNVYYKNNVPKARRIKYAIIEKMPITMLYVHPVLEKITKNWQAWKNREKTYHEKKSIYRHI